MARLINVLYAVITWLAVIHIGLTHWLGVALFVMACLQSFAVLAEWARGNL